MTTRTREKDDTVADAIDTNGDSEQALIDELQRGLAEPITDPTLVENGSGARVRLDVTAMRQEWGYDCIEISFPDPGVDIHKLCGAEAFRLAHDLKMVTDFVGPQRQALGYKR